MKIVHEVYDSKIHGCIFLDIRIPKLPTYLAQLEEELDITLVKLIPT